MSLQLYYIVFTDEGSGNSLDWFVTASSPQHAFELWRIKNELDPADYHETDEYARVYEVPAAGDVLGVISWSDIVAHDFSMRLRNLTTLAVKNEHGSSLLVGNNKGE